MQLIQQNVDCIREAIELRISSAVVGLAPRTDFYVFSYPHWVTEFARITKSQAWTTNSVIVAMCAMYAWMPTTVKGFNPISLSKLPSLLNRSAQVIEILPVAATCLSNSLVAGCKFIHIYNPEEAPIFDSTLESWLWPGTKSKLASPGVRMVRYNEWKAAINSVSPELKKVAKDWARKTFGYDVTDVRAVESLCFYTIRDERRSNNVIFASSRTTSYFPSPI